MIAARCCECRQPVTGPAVTREGVAGLRAGLIHRTITNYWHPACWDAAEAFAAESRAEYEIERQADLAALAAELGVEWPPR